MSFAKDSKGDAENEKISRFKGKHSLDSDEEDEEDADKYDMLNEDDIEGSNLAQVLCNGNF